MENEKRLIDADVCLHDMCGRCNIENEGCPCEPADCFIYNVLEYAPTVDAVEVVHAEWLVEAYMEDDSIVVIPYRKHQHNDPFCSRCQHHALLNCGEYVTSNYCPNCGANMMDGGNEDDKL